jgi:hypothetical protein
MLTLDTGKYGSFVQTPRGDTETPPSLYHQV